MTPRTVQRLDDKFASMPGLVAETVPTEEEIDAAEQQVGQRFSPQYRDFVLRYGGAMVGSLPVFGLRTAEVMGDDDSVIAVTAHFRTQRWPGSESWAVISVDLAGNPIGLAADGSVWISDHDAGEILLIAPSFEAFVLGVLDGAI